MVKPKPSEREKKRYVVFALKSSMKLSFEATKSLIIQTISKYIGEFGLSDARMFVIKNQFNEQTQKGIFRVTNKKHKDVLKALEMIKEYKGEKLSIDIVGISGILKKARYKFLVNDEV